MKVYIPQYSTKIQIMVIILPFVALFSIVALISGRTYTILPYLTLAFSVFLIVINAYGLNRQIRFGDRIYIDRYLFKPRVIEYSNIVEVIDSGVIVKDGQGISLHEVKNVNVFKDMLAEAILQTNLPIEQFQDKTVRQKRDRQALIHMAIVFAISMPTSILIAFLKPSWLMSLGRLLFLLVFLVVSLFVWAIHRIASRSN